MNNTPFTIAQMRPIRDGMTVSRPAHLGAVPVTWFSLGAGTTITPESYDCTTLYIAAEGAGCFVLGDDARPTPICPGELLVLPPKTLCGAAADTGMIYTEIILKKENFTMNIKSKLEDIFFSVIQHLPIVPGFLMNWTNDYLNRRITQLQHETIRQQWDKASLEKTLSEIHEQQQDKEKH